MLEVNDVITVKDNEKYLVVYTKEIEGKSYAFLINKNNYSFNMFSQYNSNSFAEVNDIEIIEKLLMCFKKDKGI